MVTALCALTQGLVPQDTTPHSSTSLHLSVTSFEPGKPFLMGLMIRLDKGWHCYWKNPGDSGAATSIAPQVPAGWKAEPVVWPMPHRIVTGGIVSYGYEGNPVFVCRVTPAKDASSGSVGFDAEWLICSEVCVGAKDSVRATLKTSKPAKNTFDIKLLQSMLQVAPAPRKDLSTSAYYLDKRIVLNLMNGKFPATPEKSYFFSSEPGVVDHALPQVFSGTAGHMTGSLPVSPFSAKPATRLKGVLYVPKLKPISIDVPITRGQES
jgi:thiol:disulfide interchange protein DsbD